MLHNLNLSKMFMTENITTEALNIVYFLTSELPTVLPSFGRATIDGLVDAFVCPYTRTTSRNIITYTFQPSSEFDDTSSNCYK